MYITRRSVEGANHFEGEGWRATGGICPAKIIKKKSGQRRLSHSAIRLFVKFSAIGRQKRQAFSYPYVTGMGGDRGVGGGGRKWSC